MRRRRSEAGMSLSEKLKCKRCGTVHLDDCPIAPSSCIVCGNPHPGGENVPGWAYLAGSIPIGAIACSEKCTKIAINRHMRSGRVDKPLASEKRS